MENAQNISEQSYVKNQNPQFGKLVLLYFSAQWCGPSKRMAPLIQTLTEEYRERMEIMKIDITQEERLAEDMQIRSIPSFILLRNGIEVGRKTGTMTKSELEMFFGSFME